MYSEHYSRLFEEGYTYFQDFPPAFLTLTAGVTKTGKVLLKIRSSVCFTGQLILKSPYGVFKSPKKPTIFFPGFLPWPLKRSNQKK